MPGSLLAGIADVIFPPRCATCRALLSQGEASRFCSECSDRIGFIRQPLCPRCGIPFTGSDAEDHYCGECLINEPPFIMARAVGRYEGTLLDAIHQFKYQGRIAIGETLGGLMAEFFSSTFPFSDFSLLIPVPLHARRLRQRMFNQSVMLARCMMKECALPIDFMSLRRSLYTEPQVNLGKNARAANVSGAFTVAAPDRIKGKRIILVDDVYTTGSTVKECARVLREGGAEEVAVLTLVRAV